MIRKKLNEKLQLELVKTSFRGQGKDTYNYYITLCIYFLNKPFGIFNYKRKAKKALLSMLNKTEGELNDNTNR